MSARLLCVGLLAAAVMASPSAQPPSGQTAPPQEARPQILGIARMAVRVTAWAPAREFYGSVLGFGVVKAQLTAHPACVRYQVNQRQEMAIAPGLPADEDERLSYLAFETPNLDALATYLRAHDVAVDTHAPDIACAAASLRALWVKDPDGHQLAFVEPAASAAPSRAGTTRAVSTRILHAGLTIRDAAAADRFYKDVLGFGEIWRGGRTDDVISWINMKVPNGTDYIEYMLVTGPVTRQQRGTLHHAALLVPDIQVALETARNRTSPDKRASLASPQVGRNRRWQLNLYDPDGTRIELMEPFPMR